jgi:integrase
VAARRSAGTGHVYEKWGSYYGRWRTTDGRLLNRKVGQIRTPGERDGLTRPQAERQFRRMQEAEEHTSRPLPGAELPTVEQVADSLRGKLALAGARRAYLQCCESVQRVHIAPRLGTVAVSEVKTADVETLARGMLRSGRSPKTVRNVLSFLHSIFEHAIDHGWTRENPVRRATRPGRRRQGDADPDLQFLTLDELEAVLCAIPDHVVSRAPAPTRNGRAGPAPPPPPDVLGPVLRVLVLAAAMTGLRQSELLGLRWRDVDWAAQRIRVGESLLVGGADIWGGPAPYPRLMPV